MRGLLWSPAPLVVGVLVVALVGPLVAGLDPLAQSPANRLEPPSAAHWLGRDAFGRDVFARLLVGARISIGVGLAAVALGGGLGTTVGLLAGYSGRQLEVVLMRSIDILMSFPSLLTGILVLAVLGAGLDKLIISIGIVSVPLFARVVHAATLSIRQRDFIAAARSIGASDVHIIKQHVLPNVLGQALVLVGLSLATAIRIEASLSFIGLGVSPPTPTWGNMIRDGSGVLFGAPWLAVAPGLAMLLSVVVFNLAGDRLEDLSGRTR